MKGGPGIQLTHPGAASQPPPAKPPGTADPAQPGIQGAASAAPVAAQPKRERPKQPLRVKDVLPPAPKKSYAREIKIALIVVGILVVIAGTVLGIIHWRQSAEAEKQAELNRLNQQSLDSLKDDTLKKEKYGP
jgi:hypothetical protein